jgi:2-polyprenyl-3-methyl-5-hydroxy-6-metoxy-1,4-benzoquinol methylase
MAIRLDPEGNETAALFDLVDLDGKDVLEIGCGDGRLTWRYAERTAHVTAIDPFEDAIERATDAFPDALAGRVDLHNIGFDDYAPADGRTDFDVVILSWSLC